MIRLLEAKTVAGTRYGAGDVVNFSLEIEAQLIAAGEAESMPLVLTYTWNTRPNAYTTAVGTVINISDVGGEAGSFWKATSVGWMPLNGSVKLASHWGTVLVPLGTIQADSGVFAPTGGVGSLEIPAAMLIPGHSILRVRAVIYRRGSTATGVGRIYFGTVGDATDATAFLLQMAATNLLAIRPDMEIAPISSNECTTTDYLRPGDTGTASSIRSATTQINTGAAMTVTFGITSASASDSFDLISYSVILESI